jgi:hypothetical protein
VTNKGIPIASEAPRDKSTREFRGLNEPTLEENPLFLYTMAYCDLIDALADTLFPRNLVSDGAGGQVLAGGSDARVDRYIHCRAAWDSAFASQLQLALRDLSAAAKLAYGKIFFGLAAAERNALITALQVGSIPPTSWDSPRQQKATFDTLHDAVASGMFADPGYGGNVEGVGWRYSQFIA